MWVDGHDFEPQQDLGTVPSDHVNGDQHVAQRCVHVHLLPGTAKSSLYIDIFFINFIE